MQHFVVGSNSATSNGNLLKFTGEIAINSGGTGQSRVGRFANDNQLIIEQGAKLTVGILQVGYAGDDGVAGTKNNHVLVEGPDSSLTINGVSSNRGLRIGSLGDKAADYNAGMSGNIVTIRDGASLIISGAINYISIGNTKNAHSNALVIDGKAPGGQASTVTLDHLGGNAVTIGDADGANRGGNYLEVKNGGRLTSTGLGNFIVNGYNHEGTNDGRNRLTIASDGALLLAGNLTISGGLLQLDSSGTLTAKAITIDQGGRFEAAGGGLDAEGSEGTRILAGSTLAVGSASGTAADTLKLGSKISLEKEALLELTLSPVPATGQIEILAGGAFIIDPDAIFKLLLTDDYTPSAGDSWQLFSGETQNITGRFSLSLADLPTLSDGLYWTFENFNESGGWTVDVIPEPRPAIFLMLGSLMLLWKTVWTIRR